MKLNPWRIEDSSTSESIVLCSASCAPSSCFPLYHSSLPPIPKFRPCAHVTETDRRLVHIPRLPMLLWRERSASSSDDEVDGAREMDVEGKGERVGRKLEREESEAEREESGTTHLHARFGPFVVQSLYWPSEVLGM